MWTTYHSKTKFYFSKMENTLIHKLSTYLKIILACVSMFCCMIELNLALGEDLRFEKFFLSDIPENIDIQQMCRLDKYLIQVYLKEHPTSLRLRDQSGEAAPNPEIAWIAKVGLIKNISKCVIINNIFFIYFGSSANNRKYLYPKDTISIEKRYYVLVKKDTRGRWIAEAFPATLDEYKRWLESTDSK